MIIDLNSLENISAVVCFDRAKKPRTSSQSRFWTISKMAEKTIQAQMKSEIAILIWLTQGFQKCKVLNFRLSVYELKAKNVWKSSALLCSAPY